jgi:hypothetical protein
MNARAVLFSVPWLLAACSGDAGGPLKSSAPVEQSEQPGAAGGPGTGSSGVGVGLAVPADAGAPAAPERLDYRAFTGVNTDEASLGAVASMGVMHARMDRPGAATIERARQLGIEILPVVDYGFPELSGHEDDDKYPPLPGNRAAWAKRMVDTWRGMAEPPLVFEVWNEPWSSAFWKPEPEAAAYLALVRAFAEEAWAVWPDATLLVSADKGDGEGNFRDDLLAADTTGFLSDRRIRPTVHDYVQDRSPTEITSQPCNADLDRYKCAYSAFVAHGHPDPKVWITEFGWESDTADGYSEFGTVTEQQQADYTTQAFEIFRASGMVAAAYAFCVRKAERWNYDWLRPNGAEKPVCGSVRSLLSGAASRAASPER